MKTTVNFLVACIVFMLAGAFIATSSFYYGYRKGALQGEYYQAIQDWPGMTNDELSEIQLDRLPDEDEKRTTIGKAMRNRK